MNEEFSQRLQRAFDFATMADIARRIGVPHATVRNYFHGRMPAPEVLIKIATETNVSLNWLLTGNGEMYVGPRPNVDLGKLIEEHVSNIVDQKLAERSSPGVMELGNIDLPPAFDVREAVRKFDDPQRIMNKWFRHEGRKYPQDYGVAFFAGWESYSEEEKIEAIRDAKRVLDRTLKWQPK
jgi:transcriptional regulator with XRE-family HTH domain